MASAIEVHKISKNYGSKAALHNVSFKIAEGSIFGFLGPNGAGKTTTIRCLMNFITPEQGSIEIMGQTVANNPAVRKEIGYLPSSFDLYNHWTVKEHLRFASDARGLGAKYDLADKLDLELGARVDSLSTGNRQKLLIALAMTGNPAVLILDEPTKGLDPLLQSQLYEILLDHRQNGGTIFMSSHNLPEVEEMCDAIAVIKEGRIIMSETLESIRHKSVREVSLTFKSTVSETIFQIPNVKIVAHHAQSFKLKVTGDIDPLLKVISNHAVADLTISHASLEELFKEIYE